MLKLIINSSSIRTVIFSNYWKEKINVGTNNNNEFISILSHFKKSKKNVILAINVPEFSYQPLSCAIKQAFSFSNNNCIEKIFL